MVVVSIDPEQPHRFITDFQPARMVYWFHPVEIARTAVRAVLAATVTRYSDPRDALATEPAAEATNEDIVSAWRLTTETLDMRADAKGDERSEIWFDYVSDTGDGFDPTYAVACTLACRSLPVEGHPDRLERGAFIVLGGDQVYPSPTAKDYRNRFRIPFQRAFPHPTDEAQTPDAPLMLAIPGNHDWYDGLRHFTQVFCDGRWIGGWRTVQRRSYFEVVLPGGWRLWGNDTALSADLDRAQLDFFRSRAIRAANENVILCTANPSWLDDRRTRRARTGRYFEDQVVRRLDQFATRALEGPKLPLVLSGDLHCYARYELEPEREGGVEASPVEPRHRIICGGGGAYTTGTHDLPDWIRVPEDDPSRPRQTKEERGVRYVRVGPGYPDRIASKRLALRAISFPFRRANMAFCVSFGVMLSLYAGYVEWVSRGLAASTGLPAEPLMRLIARLCDADTAAWTALGEMGRLILSLTGPAPSVAALPITTAIGAMVFVHASNERGPRVTKLAAGLALPVTGWVMVAAILFLTVCLTRPWLPAGMTGGILVHVIFGTWSGFATGALVGIYLAFSNRWLGWHRNEVFSCQPIVDYHSFLRCHIGPEGKLTIYPIAVERVPRRWRARSEFDPDSRVDQGASRRSDPADLLGPCRYDAGREPVMVPVEGTLKARLIEPPITIEPRQPSNDSPGADGKPPDEDPDRDLGFYKAMIESEGW